LSRPGDYFVSLDLADGYYTLGITKEDRDLFTVNYRGELWRLACLPMGLLGSASHFLQANACVHKLPPASINAPNRKDDYVSQAHEKISAQHLLARNLTLLYMDDFMLMAHSRQAALLLRDRVEALLH
jgi:hypothetical protein